MDEAYFIRPGEGERVASRGHRVLAELPHFEGVDPHTHSDHTDSFYVLEGELEFLQDGEWQRVGPGTFLSVPPNVEHGFRPCGSSFRLLNFHTPRVGFIERLRKR
jgi:quercetin dioxygenase-like cupin family protein